MTTKSDPFKQHRNKVIDAYLNWEKCLFIKVKALSIARICADNILQALVIDRFGITDFTEDSYLKLKSQGYFSKDHDDLFGTSKCRHLIFKHTDLLDENLRKDFIEINNKAIGDIHYAASIDDEQFDNIKKRLFNIINWFFVEYEKEPNWKDLYINPGLSITPSKLMAEQIAKFLKDEGLQNGLKDKISKIINNNYIIISTFAFTALGVILIFFFKPFFPELTINTKSNDYIYSNTPFHTTKDSYNVLLFPFQKLEKNRNEKTDIELTIISRLFEMSEKDSLNIEIKYDTLDCIHKPSEAELIGKKLKANLVLWGDLYEHSTNDNEACLRFVNISSKNRVPGLDLKDESGIEKMSTLSEVKEGKLQRNTDYIIYWVAATRSFAKNNFVKALQYFTKIENSYLVTCELYLYIGCCNFSLESFNEAKDHFEKALKINPNSEMGHYNYAGLLEKLNDFNGAKEHYEKALDIDPNDARAHNNYGVLLHNKLNDLRTAKEHFEKALKIDPNLAEAQINYAFLLADLNDPKGAKEHYEKALKINPNDAVAHHNYAFLLQNKFNDLKTAKEHYEKALKIDPNFEAAHYNYARLLSDLKDLSSAKDHYEKALKINPNGVKALNNYACLLVELNDPKRAKEQFEKALNIDPNYVDAYNNYAYLLFELNDLKGAKEYFEKALKIDPNSAGTHNNYALLLHHKFNDLKTAKEHFEKALKIDPNFVEAYNNYALLLADLNDPTRAKEYFEKALTIDPNSAKAHNNYAGFLEKLDSNEAKKHYEKALKINPNYAEAHNNYACFLEEFDSTGAKDHFEKALKINPNLALTHYSYAILLHAKFKEIKEGENHYLKAIELDPKIKTKENDAYFGVK